MDVSLSASDNLLQNDVTKSIFCCELCPKKYAIAMRFNRHQNDHKNGKVVTKSTKQNWKCEFCEKSMSSYARLKTHESTHTQLGKKCTFCEDIFSDKSDLAKQQVYKYISLLVPAQSLLLAHSVKRASHKLGR